MNLSKLRNGFCNLFNFDHLIQAPKDSTKEKVAKVAVLGFSYPMICYGAGICLFTAAQLSGAFLAFAGVGALKVANFYFTPDKTDAKEVEKEEEPVNEIFAAYAYVAAANRPKAVPSPKNLPEA